MKTSGVSVIFRFLCTFCLIWTRPWRCCSFICRCIHVNACNRLSASPRIKQRPHTDAHWISSG
jgi:hypothetical protein